MDCQQVLEYLKDNLGKKVPRHMGSVLREHLQSCPSCQDYYKGIYQTHLQEKNKIGSTHQPSSDSSFLPVKFPGYKIIRKIGSGAMGKVYQAYQISLKRNVALKVLSEELAQNAKFVKRFLREAQALGEMKHPNLVQVYDVGFSQGIFYYIMEYVDGESLKDVLEKRRTLPLEESLDIITQVARALSHAHEHNIVHRDIKPGNILIDKKGICKLADLGLAKKRWENEKVSEETAVGTLIGTPHYMAPEQIRSSKDVNIQADIYSLGVTFYQMLTGTLPHSGSTNFEVLSNILNEEVEFIDKRDSMISEGYRKVILKMLSKETEIRYKDPKELLKDLDSIKRGEDVHGTQVSWRRFAIPEASHKLIIWAIAIGSMGTLIIVLIVFLVIWKISGPTPPVNNNTKINQPEKNPKPTPPKNPINTTPNTPVKNGGGEKIIEVSQIAHIYDNKFAEESTVFIPNAMIVEKYIRKRDKSFYTVMYISDFSTDIPLALYLPFSHPSSFQCGDSVSVHGKLTKYLGWWQISLRKLDEGNSKYLKKLQGKNKFEEIKDFSQLGTHLQDYVMVEGKIFKYTTHSYTQRIKKDGQEHVNHPKFIVGQIEIHQRKIYFLINPWMRQTLNNLNLDELLGQREPLCFLGRWVLFDPIKAKGWSYEQGKEGYTEFFDPGSYESLRKTFQITPGEPWYLLMVSEIRSSKEK